MTLFLCIIGGQVWAKLKILLLLLAFSFTQFAAATDAERALRTEINKGLAKGLPSISAAIATRQGVIWTGAVGFADLQTQRRAHPAYFYGIGSITKTFIACVVQQLVDEGKLNIDSTALELLGPKVAGGIPNADIANIRQLLSHTSGIPTWEFDAEWMHRGRGELMTIAHVWDKAETLRYIRDGRHAATNVPGAGYAYSNSNYTLLGLIVEKVTGMDALAAIRQRVLVPLGLNEIKLEGFERVSPLRVPTRYHFATPEFLRDVGVHPSFKWVSRQLIDVSGSNLSTEWVAGGMLASARDLAEFARALRDGEVVGPIAMKRLLTFQPTGETSGGEQEVSEGLFRGRYGSDVLIGHTGDVLGFSATMGWLEGEDMVLVLLANAGSMHSGTGSYFLAQLLMDTQVIQRAKELARTLRVEPQPQKSSTSLKSKTVVPLHRRFGS